MGPLVKDSMQRAADAVGRFPRTNMLIRRRALARFSRRRHAVTPVQVTIRRESWATSITPLAGVLAAVRHLV